jgi:BASS family bile acid:Na+ symporter
MTPAQLVPIVLQISIALIVFSVAVQASPGDLTYLLRRPSLMIRSLLAMNVVMPIVAALIAGVFQLSPAVEVALILLAVSPVPPILPRKETKAGGNVSYAIGLLAMSAALAIVTVPASVTLIGQLFGHDLHVPMAAIAVVVAKSVLAPLAIGFIVGRLARSVAARIAKPLALLAMVVLLLGIVLILASTWRAIVAQIGGFTVLAIVLFTLVSLVVGHLLGGPDHDDRTVLALSTASRHPGVAMTIASAIAPDRQAVGAVLGAVLLCVLVGAIVSGTYVKWRQRGQAKPAPSTT